MLLDDVYGSELDEILARQEAAWRDREPPELEWDESETSLAVEEVLGRSRIQGNYHS